MNGIDSIILTIGVFLVFAGWCNMIWGWDAPLETAPDTDDTLCAVCGEYCAPENLCRHGECWNVGHCAGFDSWLCASCCADYNERVA